MRSGNRMFRMAGDSVDYQMQRKKKEGLTALQRFAIFSFIVCVYLAIAYFYKRQ